MKSARTNDSIKEKLFKPTGIHHTNVLLNNSEFAFELVLVLAFCELVVASVVLALSRSMGWSFPELKNALLTAF